VSNRHHSSCLCLEIPLPLLFIRGHQQFPGPGREPDDHRGAAREAARTRTPRGDPRPAPQPVTSEPQAHPRASRLRSAGPPAARAPQPARQHLSHLSPRIPSATLPAPLGTVTHLRPPIASATSALGTSATSALGHRQRLCRPPPSASSANSALGSRQRPCRDSAPGHAPATAASGAPSSTLPASPSGTGALIDGRGP
jgi:hypothetical protein